MFYTATNNVHFNNSYLISLGRNSKLLLQTQPSTIYSDSSYIELQTKLIAKKCLPLSIQKWFKKFSYLLISSGISLILLLFRLRNFRLLSPPKNYKKRLHISDYYWATFTLHEVVVYFAKLKITKKGYM